MERGGFVTKRLLHSLCDQATACGSAGLLSPARNAAHLVCVLALSPSTVAADVATVEEMLELAEKVRSGQQLASAAAITLIGSAATAPCIPLCTGLGD